MKRLLVKSSRNIYPVIFEKNLKDTLKKLNADNKLHLLTDKTIWDRYKNLFKSKDEYTSIKIFIATEENKNLERAAEYIEFLLKNKIHRNHKVVVIGGGLVQDIGSFTANVILRGVDWIFIPSTLLSMADSCIGSKSGINIGKYKNQVGTFHPPYAVYIYLPFLNSLSKEEMINGIGEILKHGLIAGGRDFNFIKKNISKLGKNRKLTEEIIYKSLSLKKEIIEKDEFEKNVRKLLSYGHTFGHALEGYTKYKIPHGLGVLIGMDLANYISLKRGLLTTSEFKEIHRLLYKYIWGPHIFMRDCDAYMDFLRHDKKVIGSVVSALLCEGVGKIKIVKLELDNRLKENIKEYFDKYQK